jgi:uncharacterized protein YbjT (DUF2867 family)
MDVVVAGAHGKIARLLVPRLVARGDRVRGIIRDRDQVPDVEGDGAEPVVCDLEHADDRAVTDAVMGAGAIVFAVGAGPGSGAARKWTADHGAARRLINAATAGGIRRFVMISAMGTDSPPQDDAVFSVYLRAKAQADDDLRAAGLDHTIVRPGRLHDGPGVGTVAVARHVPGGEVARDDVAAVLAEVLADARTYRRTFEVVGGSTPVADVPAIVEGISADP